MGFLIDCPNCGRRPYTEFWCEGELVVRASEEARTDAEEYERVWLRRNVAGVHREEWFHYAGCRRWSTVTRDTRTNELHAVD